MFPTQKQRLQAGVGRRHEMCHLSKIRDTQLQAKGTPVSTDNEGQQVNKEAGMERAVAWAPSGNATAAGAWNADDTRATAGSGRVGKNDMRREPASPCFRRDISEKREKGRKKKGGTHDVLS